MDAAIIPGLDLDRAALDRARMSRDPRFDGRFYIGVLSTRIYCRPICPAPSPKPCNIRYYPTAAAAAEAGLRPCLRCRPEVAPDSPAWLGASAVVRRALRLIQEGALDEGSVEALSTRLGIGPRHLRRLFIQHVGASPVAVAQTRRLHFAKRLIDETNLSMTEIALASGYGSVRRFNAAIRASYQRTPSELRHRRRGKVADRGDSIVLRLAYRPPYDWDGLLKYLTERAIPEIERVDGRCYSRTAVLDGKPGYITVRAAEGTHAIEFEVHGASATELFGLVSRARRMFDLSVDPARIAFALQREPMLAPLVKRYPGVRIPGCWEGFECAVCAVLSQGSLSGDRRLLSRLVRSCSARVPAPHILDAGLTHLFPTAQALAVAELEGIGLAGPQIAAVKALAVAFLERRIDFDAPAEELIRTLVALPGVSDSAAQYIALRALGYPDAFPAARLDLCRPARRSCFSLGKRPLSEIADAWRPWRSYAALCLWRAQEDRPGTDRFPSPRSRNTA
ncbi:MAG: AlkA N-terminal domain-containing protein [Woeseiaceae bacterium]